MMTACMCACRCACVTSKQIMITCTCANEWVYYGCVREQMSTSTVTKCKQSIRVYPIGNLREL